jgi:prevent-host-death family protein
MTTMTASKARASLYRLIRETAASHEPVQITGKGAEAVLISAEDWRAVQETLHLLSVPGMRASVRRGLATPLAKCSRDLPW